MASSPTLPFMIISTLLLLLIIPSNAQTPPKPKAFIFPITKDTATNQYYTAVQIGSNATAFNVVVDLGGKFLWFNALDYFDAAASYRPILCGTQMCRLADGVGCVFCYLSPPVPGCTNNTCSDYALNPFTGTQGYSGLGRDVLRVSSVQRDYYDVKNFPFQFSDPVLREGLAAPTAGLIGLGRTRISLPAQLASSFKIREKFSLCIPSSGYTGNMIVGETAYRNPFQKVSESIISTPLIKNPVSTYGNEVVGNFSVEYFIGVTAIKVGETPLKLNKTLLSINKKTGDGGTSIRTVRPYTTLRRPIYRAVVDEFVKAAEGKNIKRVASVAPFGACFDVKTIPSSKTGGDVPTIDLVMQSKNAYWRFYGANSLVRVGDGGVACLAFVEGQPNLTGPTTSVVVGGYQLENYLLEFDVVSSKLGFSSSLLLSDTSCSEFGAA